MLNFNSFLADYLILKNRKVMGSLQYHRIQQRAVGEGPKKQRCLIQEINTPVITKSKPTPPKFRIIRDPAQGEPEVLTAQVYVKEAVSFDSAFIILETGLNYIN